MKTKTDLINALADGTGVLKKDVEAIVNNLPFAIRAALKNGGEANLHGVGIFKAKKVEAREGRNPSTGEKIQIAAKTKVTFKPAKALADAIA